MKRAIQLLFICALPFVALADDTSAPKAFQLRLVADGPSADSQEMTLTNKDRAPETLYVMKKVLIDQKDVKSARVVKDNLGRPEISIEFTDAGSKRLAEVTRDNIGKRLATVMAGQVYCAPRIASQISGGKAVINGDFTNEEAKEIVDRIMKPVKK